MNVALEGPSSCSDQIYKYKEAGDLPYLGMPSIYKPRIPRTPTRRPAPRTPDPDELVTTPAEDPTADDEGSRRDAGQSNDPLVTVIVDISNIPLTDEEKAANDTMKADLSAE
eukprot:7856259-Pyramimonas_sp.AAC.1